MKRNICYQLLCAVFLWCTAFTCNDTPQEYESKYTSIYNDTHEAVYMADGISRTDDDSNNDSPYGVMKYELKNRLVKVDAGETYRYMRVVMDGRERERRYHVLVLNAETMERHTPQELIDGNIYDKWYVLTYDELEAADFTITYNGE